MSTDSVSDKAAGFLLDPAACKEFVNWRLTDPAVRRHFQNQQGATMSEVQITLEVRVDFDDPAKVQVMRELMAEKTREIIATAEMMIDKGIKPKAALHSDNFFMSPAEFDIMTGVTATKADAAVVNDGDVSESMLNALKDME